MKKIRVLHVPTVTGGSSFGIAKAERAAGLDSISVSLYQNDFGYKLDKVLWTSCRFSLANEIKRWNLIRQAMTQYDVIHYNNGTTIAFPIFLYSSFTNYPVWKRWPFWFYTNLLQKIELFLMKLSKKTLFVTYQGDDARQGYYCEEHYKISAVHEVESGYYSEQSDKEKRDHINLLSKYCDGIYALNPDLLNVLPDSSQFLPYAHLDLNEWLPVRSNNDKPLIIHAPSHQGVKGTRFILEAIEKLKNEGLDFDFELIEGLTHAEARVRYESADLVIDQLLIGWYGGFSVEMMALGKPVICYIRKEDLKFIPQDMAEQLPVINASSDTIYSVLKQWIIKPESELKLQGKKCREYVEKWHDPEKIVQQLKQDYVSALKNHT